MNFDPQKHHRQSIRLRGHDYTQTGAYFITLRIYQRECLFGEVVSGTMQLNEYGQVVAGCWQWLSDQYSYVDLDSWVIMPNHLHGIIVITTNGRGDITDGRGDSRIAPTGNASTGNASTGNASTETTPTGTASTGNASTQTIPTGTTPTQTIPTGNASTGTTSIQIASTDEPKRKPLGRLIGAFKTISTKQINVIRNTPSALVWQRNYYEHIIRNETALHNIRQYILENPRRWADDVENLRNYSDSQ